MIKREICRCCAGAIPECAPVSWTNDESDCSKLQI